MPAIAEGLNLGDLLKFEAPHLYSRDVVSIVAGQMLPRGTVLGRIGGSGQMTRLDPASSNGSQLAIGILLFDIDATTRARQDAIMLARMATVADHAVRWPVGITPDEQQLALDQLKALGILVRQGI